MTAAGLRDRRNGGTRAADRRHGDDDALANHATGLVQSCGFDFLLPDASNNFHDYGVLWTQDRIVYFIDRDPVSDIKVPMGFDDPMYMIVNLAMGAKYFKGVKFIDADLPVMVEFQIDRIYAYQIDP